MASNNNNILKPPTPPEMRIECGYCHKVMPESEFKNHQCLTRTLFPVMVGGFVALFILSLIMLFFKDKLVL